MECEMQITRRLDANWDLSFGQGINNYCINQESCAQNVRSRLLLLLGEWFLDTNAGCLNTIILQQKPANLPYLEGVIKACILQTDDVDELISFNMTYDWNNRKLLIDASLLTIYGTIENIQVRLP
jgi:hypothetical protein